MRKPVIGWRSSSRRYAGGGLLSAQPASGQLTLPGAAHGGQAFAQEPLRIGLGLVALVVYLFVIHSYKLPVGDLAVLGLGVGVLLRGGPLRLPRTLALFGLFVLWGCVGLLVTESAVVTNKALLELAKVWIITFGIVNVVRNAAELRFFVIAWLGFYALYPVRGALYNQYICHCTSLGRVAWNFIFSNPNDLAALTFMPLGLAAGVAYVERVKLWRAAGAVGVGVLGLLIMLTQSRGAMLAMGLAVLLLVFSSKRRGRDLLLLGAVMCAAAIAAPKGVWERLAGLAKVSVQGRMQGVDPEGSAEARWQIWQIGLRTARDNPLVGIGPGMMPYAHRDEAARENAGWNVGGVRDTHSTYIRIAAEMGIPGLVIYFSIWGSVLWHLRRVRKQLRAVRPREHQMLLFIELALIAYLIASTFGTYGWLSFTYIGITMAWLAASILEREPWYVPPSLRTSLPAAAGHNVRRRQR